MYHSRVANSQFTPFSTRGPIWCPSESWFAENSLFQESVLSDRWGLTVQKNLLFLKFKNFAYVRELNWKWARGRLQISLEHRSVRQTLFSRQCWVQFNVEFRCLLPNHTCISWYISAPPILATEADSNHNILGLYFLRSCGMGKLPQLTEFLQFWFTEVTNSFTSQP